MIQVKYCSVKWKSKQEMDLEREKREKSPKINTNHKKVSMVAGKQIYLILSLSLSLPLFDCCISLPPFFPFFRFRQIWNCLRSVFTDSLFPFLSISHRSIEHFTGQLSCRNPVHNWREKIVTSGVNGSRIVFVSLFLVPSLKFPFELK